MNTKITKGKILNLIGWDGKRIVPIKHTVCFRKPANLQQTQQIMSKYKYAIGITSSHNIHRKANTPFCKIWCHCFRDPEKYLPGYPKLLLSESDFVDPLSIKIRKIKHFTWDLCYFTMGGKLGNDYKGMHVFVDSLPIICGKFNLKIVVVKYSKSNIGFVLDKRRRRILQKYKRNITILKGRRDASIIMSKSRFSYFPNIQDCSPLLISECLVRNRPVLINYNILGGWKYANNDTGDIFTLDNLEDKIRFMLNHKFNPACNYMINYGYKNAALRLSDFCKQHIPEFSEYRMVGFSGTQEVMGQYI